VYDHGWQIDAEAIRRAITPQTRAIVVVHPNNPTGHFTKPWEAAELARLCREFDLALIVDEVFLDYRIGATLEGTGEKARASAGLETRTTAGQETGATGESSGEVGSFAAGLELVPVFVVSGMSKIAGLPQMKAAWIVVTGEERQRALERLEVIADTFLSMNAPAQWALPEWLAGRGAIQQQIRGRVAANLALLDRRLSALPAIE